MTMQYCFCFCFQVRVNNADEGMPDQYVPVRLIASSSTGGWLTREAYRYTGLSYSAIPHSTLLHFIISALITLCSSLKSR